MTLCCMDSAIALQVGVGPLEEQERWKGAAHPGARASRPHALPLRAAQFPCGAAPGHFHGGNGMGPAEAEHLACLPVERVEEMAEAVPELVRAGRPRSRVGLIP